MLRICLVHDITVLMHPPPLTEPLKIISLSLKGFAHYWELQPSRGVLLATQSSSYPATDLVYASGCSDSARHNPLPSLAFATRCCNLVWLGQTPYKTLTGGCCSLSLPSCLHPGLSMQTGRCDSLG